MQSTRTEFAGVVPEALGFLLQLGDSALPTGAFSHSFGMESYIADGTVHDEDTLAVLLGAYLDTQLLRTDALAMRQAVRGEVPPGELDALLDVAIVPAQVRTASLKMGAQLNRLVAQMLPGVGLGTPGGPAPRHFCLVFALAADTAGAALPEILHAYLRSSVASLVQNAVRAVPLGQMAGVRVLTRLRPAIRDAADAALSLPPEDFGAAAPGLEIAQMRHETLHARMFMS